MNIDPSTYPECWKESNGFFIYYFPITGSNLHQHKDPLTATSTTIEPDNEFTKASSSARQANHQTALEQVNRRRQERVNLVSRTCLTILQGVEFLSEGKRNYNYLFHILPGRSAIKPTGQKVLKNGKADQKTIP